MKNKTLAGWVALGIAVALWGAVIYAYMDVEKRKNEHLGIVTGAQELAQKEMSSSRLHGFMNETKQDRDAISKSAAVDIVSIVDSVESAGKLSGAVVQISNALPEKLKLSSGDLTSVRFTIQAEGSFEHISQFLSLLNTLPLPVHIQQFDISRSEGASDSIWKASILVTALTTTKISS